MYRFRVTILAPDYNSYTIYMFGDSHSDIEGFFRIMNPYMSTPVITQIGAACIGLENL